MLIHKEMEEVYPKLKYFCLSMTGNSWDAEDLAHDSMLKALRFCQKDPSAKRVPNFPLLATIARNHWIDQLRKKGRETAGPSEEEPSSEKPPELLMSGLETLMERLTPKQLLAFVLKDVFEYKLSDIADSLETSETAVKSLLHRARHNLNGEELAEAPASAQEWENIDADWFQRQLLVSIRMEQPELLQRLAVQLRKTAQAPAQRRTHSSGNLSMSLQLRAA
ncbi:MULTISPECIES: RNA polymerase sigma factor [Paenibacillus]|uniref:DNA-directed RNA polymerase sigma-70 factor n=1 Tax=Paenibacillus albilobatus TaxID=2716884 RepID=A0A919XIK2_9BACL|nr:MULTISPECIES: sigma-70 family RNA polymerase sigma factor [Paenibacillus]GIO32048.1 DNA-directed RNA polymerase sigma-70 factor [Paenibacillus albilobatus]